MRQTMYSPVSGVLSESVGWPAFFLFSALAAVPGLYMVWRMRAAILSLNAKDN